MQIRDLELSLTPGLLCASNAILGILYVPQFPIHKMGVIIIPALPPSPRCVVKKWCVAALEGGALHRFWL